MSTATSRMVLRAQCRGATTVVRPGRSPGYVISRRPSIARVPSASWVPYTQQNQEYRDLLKKRASSYERRITEKDFQPLPTEEPAQQQTDPFAEAEPGTRISALEQMRILKEAQERSQMELAKASVNPTIGADPNTPREFRGHRTVDVRMYDQLSASRNRMSQNLSRANKYVNILEADIEERDAHIAEMKRVMDGFKSEMATLMRLTERAKAAAQFSVEKQAAVDEMDKIMERVKMLDQVATDDVAAMDKFVVREVPVSYSGTGAEVRIMGCFDGWTMGKQLSSSSMDDSVFQTFTTTLHLLPGTYRVKFLVDDEWRTAGEWHTVTDSKGNLENLIVVE